MRGDTNAGWEVIIGFGVLAVLFAYGAVAVPSLGLLRYCCALPASIGLGLMVLYLLLEQVGIIDPNAGAGSSPPTLEDARNELKDAGFTEDEIKDILGE